jgi:hypothetical protein
LYIQSSTREANTVKCVHLGDKVGSVITACCNGSERRTALYTCNCEQKPEQYTVPNSTVTGMTVIEIDGHRAVQSVAGCGKCQFFESDKPLPDFENDVPKSRASQMWHELRRKHDAARQTIQPIHECFRNYVHQESPIKTRHLLYHLWPRSGSVWKEHLAGIERRLPLFNGRKIVSIVEDETTDDVDILWADKIIRMRNDPKLGEVVTFVPKLKELSDMGSDEAAFYCHGKGVKHDNSDNVTVHLWSDIMSEVLLDHWPYIGGLLATHPIVGAFKSLGRSLSPTGPAWFYTGTYYWFRNDIFSRNWRHVDQAYWGTEAWPGVQFSEWEGACAFLSGSSARLNLYDMNLMMTKIEPRLELFRRVMHEYREQWVPA